MANNQNEKNPTESGSQPIAQVPPEPDERGLKKPTNGNATPVNEPDTKQWS